jgi:hypothetical protein
MVPCWLHFATSMVVEMTNLTVKNIPPIIYERLKQRATDNRRSINSEILMIIEQALQTRTPAEVERLIEGARKVRELSAGYSLTTEEIQKAIDEGRE